jgi:hypothetical protein
MKKFIKVLLCFSLLPSMSHAAILYNGETAPYSAGGGWDNNKSSISQKTISPYSRPNHIRASINVVNWWGGVAYVFNNWKPVDISKAATVKFAAKASTATDLLIQLYDGTNNSAKYSVKLTTSYQTITVPMNAFTGVDASKTVAMVFAISKAGTSTVTVDVDNIETIDGGGTGTDIPPPIIDASVRQKAYDLAMYLKGKPNFLVGAGGIDTTNLKLDIYYRYLVGGWRKWNSPDGAYADIVTSIADGANSVPLFTYYVLAYNFEIKNYGFLTSKEMHQYLADMRVLFQKLKAYNKPAMLHIEPDFFGYLQQYAVKINTPAANIPAKIRYPDLPECSSLPENVGGMLNCILTMGRTIAPKVKMGYHASGWGDWYDPNQPNQIIPKGKSVANFLLSVGGDKTDFIVLETSDRDAGYLEVARGAKGAYPSQRNFDVHFTWVSSITSTMKKPCLWWQMPFGVPSESSGYDYHYRDNRVPHFFSNTPLAVNVGGFGMVFGAGADKQTTPATDNGQFKAATDKYRANPTVIK